MFKIICIDNWNRETESDSLVADNIQNENWGRIMVDTLKELHGPHSDYYFVLVSQDYKLYKFEL